VVVVVRDAETRRVVGSTAPSTITSTHGWRRGD